MREIKKSVYIIIPVHNRKEITLQCIKTLDGNGDLDRYYLVVVDDGSTDGTSEAITEQYPDVIILKGDGNLWWTGAIKKGMEYAYGRGANYFIWLNDDTLPAPNTLNLLLKNSISNPRQVLTAQCYADPSLSQPTYGGRRVQGGRLLFLAAQPQEVLCCDVCSGNLVCLPRSIVDTIGYPPSQQAPQNWADVVYTWMAKQADFEIKVLGSAIAICPNNPLAEGWSSSQIPMLRQWQLLRSPKSGIYPPAYWFYCRQVYGNWGVVLFLQVYLKLVFFTILRMILPLSWITKLKNLGNH